MQCDEFDIDTQKGGVDDGKVISFTQLMLKGAGHVVIPELCSFEFYTKISV